MGVQEGWYLSCIDGNALPGATTGLRRCIPEITTERLKHILKAARDSALRAGGPRRVVLSFWTRPTSFFLEYGEDTPIEAQTVSELKKILVAKYGSIVTAWGQLDTDGSGTLDYGEFLTACRAIGFEGSLKKVFDELDKDGSGEISLHELDPHFQFDHTKGRCVVCTLPNPCEKHKEKEQKKFLQAQREQIQMKEALAEGG